MNTQGRKYIAWIRASLLILLGCIPATILCYFALPLAASGVFFFITGGGWLYLATGAWGLAGVVGTLSLWTISLGFPSPLRYLGLSVGIAANLLMAPAFARSYVSPWFSGDWLVFFSPSVVAIYLLAELIYSAYKLGAKNTGSTTS